ncbi:hypothetical protein IFM89_015119, partial [Coptis chinensis]
GSGIGTPKYGIGTLFGKRALEKWLFCLCPSRWVYILVDTVSGCREFPQSSAVRCHESKALTAVRSFHAFSPEEVASVARIEDIKGGAASAHPRPIPTNIVSLFPQILHRHLCPDRPPFLRFLECDLVRMWSPDAVMLNRSSFTETRFLSGEILELPKVPKVPFPEKNVTLFCSPCGFFFDATTNTYKVVFTLAFTPELLKSSGVLEP